MEFVNRTLLSFVIDPLRGLTVSSTHYCITQPLNTEEALCDLHGNINFRKSYWACILQLSEYTCEVFALL